MASQKKKKLKVRFLNPLEGNGITSLARAERYVRQGRARMVSVGIYEFCRSIGEHRSMSAAKSATRCYRDGPGYATLEGLKHTPVVQPIRLLTGHKPATPPKDYPQPIVLFRRYTPLANCLIP